MNIAAPTKQLDPYNDPQDLARLRLSISRMDWRGLGH